jgi:hypothetical protein
MFQTAATTASSICGPRVLPSEKIISAALPELLVERQNGIEHPGLF